MRQFFLITYCYTVTRQCSRAKTTFITFDTFLQVFYTTEEASWFRETEIYQVS